MRQDLPEFLTAAEVAKVARVSLSTVSRWATGGQLAGVRLGGAWRFRRQDVERALAEGIPTDRAAS